MNSLLLAEFYTAPTSVVGWALWAVVAISVGYIVVLFLRDKGIAVPPIFQNILWTVVIAVVVIVAILFVANLAGIR
jgi:hypothetical protein